MGLLRFYLEKNSCDHDREFDVAKELFQLIEKQKISPFYFISIEIELISQVKCAINLAFESGNNFNIMGEGSIIEKSNDMSWTRECAKKIVKFCTNMEAFNSIKQTDQTVVLRHFARKILLVCNAFLNDDVKNIPITSESHLEFNSSRDQHLPNNLINYLTSLNMELENEFTIRDLIIVQLLFNPIKEEISCPELINYQHFIYSHLLKRYLMNKYHSTQKAEHKFTLLTEILNRITTIHKDFKISLFENCADYTEKIFLDQRS